MPSRRHRSGRVDEGGVVVAAQFERAGYVSLSTTSHTADLMCVNSPKCRHDHRREQRRRWTVDQVTTGTFRWTAPSRRIYDTEPAPLPI